MKKLCMALSVVLWLFASPLVCFGDSVIPISGGANLMILRGTGDSLFISGPGLSFETIYGSPNSSFIPTRCPLETPCILELQAEVWAEYGHWSYPGLSNEVWSPPARADFTIFPIPFTLPDLCASSPDPYCYFEAEMYPEAYGLVPGPLPASILGTLMFPTASGGYRDARFIGTGTIRFQSVGHVAGSAFIGAGMEFEGTAFLSPEPGTFILLCSGLGGLAVALRRRMHRAG